MENQFNLQSTPHLAKSAASTSSYSKLAGYPAHVKVPAAITRSEIPSSQNNRQVDNHTAIDAKFKLHIMDLLGKSIQTVRESGHVHCHVAIHPTGFLRPTVINYKQIR